MKIAKEKQLMPIVWSKVKDMTFEHFFNWVRSYPINNEVSDEQIKEKYELMTGNKATLPKSKSNKKKIEENGEL